MYVLRGMIVAHAGQLKAGKAWSETSREVDAWGVWHHELAIVRKATWKLDRRVSETSSRESDLTNGAELLLAVDQ